MMDIRRDDLMRALADFAARGSGLVVGSPGVGKTYTLVQLANLLQQQGAPYLYLPIDKLGVENDAELRTTLNIDKDIVDFLSDQIVPSAIQHGLLLVDAFDAALSQASERFFLSLIDRVIRILRGSWNVIVSVRIYDAQKSIHLQDLFPGRTVEQPLANHQLTALPCRHFLIPSLEAEEVEKYVKQVPAMQAIYDGASKELRELLGIPFNLWLMERLAAENPDLSELSSVTSEVQLLDLFWKRRVTSRPLGHDMRRLLYRTTSTMVSQRSLSVSTDSVYEPGTNVAWDSLFSSEILQFTAPTMQRVTFVHNILFDYAVSVLLLSEDYEELLRFLISDPSNPLFLRASLNFYFARLWHTDPGRFWNAFWRFLPNNTLHLRAFARLLPTAVVAMDSRRIEDLSPLLESLSEDTSPSAVEAVRLIIQALQSLGITRDTLWATFFERALAHPDQGFAWDLAVATSGIIERARANSDTPTVETCGRIGRRLLGWIWQHREENPNWFDSLAGSWGIATVTRTFHTDPVTSRELLEPILTQIGEPDYSVDGLFRLISDLKYICPVDPSFVASIYVAVFAQEISNDSPHFLGGPILVLSMDNRQYYNSCRHQLVEYLPNFLRIAPKVAAAAAIQSVNLFVIRSHIIRYVADAAAIEAATQHFWFRGGEAAYLADGSYIWDSGGYVEQPIEMALQLYNFLSILPSADTSSDLDSILDVIRDHTRVAYLWRRLLSVAAHSPEKFASRFVDLCLARPIQTNPETVYELGEFLKKAATILSTSDLGRVERSILSITDAETTRENVVHYRDRLLSCIPEALLQTEEARSLRTAMGTRTPINTPIATSQIEYTSYSETDWLTDQGVDITKADNERLLRHSSVLTEFSSRYLNEVPSDEAISSMVPIISETYTLLTSDTDADQEVATSAWTHIGSCAAIISRAASRLAPSVFDVCRRILIACARSEQPIADPASTFTSPSWSPSPRAEAAEGIPRIVRREADSETIESIMRLVHDPVHAVRYLVVRELNLIVDREPTIFWELATELADHEQNQVVLDALCGMLGRVVIAHQSQTSDVLARLFDRVSVGDLHLIPDTFISLTLWLTFVRRDEWATGVAIAIAQNPIRFAPILQKAAMNATTCITPDTISAAESRGVAEKAIEWLISLIDMAASGLNELISRAGAGSSEEQSETIRALYSPVDEAVLRLYFAAGIDSISAARGNTVSDTQREAFYFAVRPILESVLRFASAGANSFITASTADLFMKLLNGVLTYDPEVVLHMAAKLVQAAERSSYNFDASAASQVVRFAETILADYRSRVREGQPLLDLLSLLDTFAKVGWPDALRLVWRLDEVFR